MRYSELENCCGAVVLSDFGFTDVTGGNHRANPQFYGKPSPSLDEVKSWLENTIAKCTGYGIFIITFNEEQKQILGPVIEEYGFKIVSEGLNSAHNSKIYLYTLCDMEYHNNDEDYYEYDDEEEEP